MQRNRMILDFNTVCKKVYNAYRNGGISGIGGILDAGDEWIFVPGPDMDGDILTGVNPIFFNKKTGNVRAARFWNDDDDRLINNSKEIDVPQEYRSN